jgi:6-phosphofructokinase 2
MSKKHIVTLTINSALDISTVIDRVIPEHKLRCRNPVYEPGGGGINVSRAIKKLGGESKALFTSGGYTGNILDSLLKQEDITCCALTIGERTRESFAVFEESTGLQYRFSMEGPFLRKNEWEEVFKMLWNERPRPDYIVGSGLLPPGVPQDFYARIARAGRDLGARVIIDTSGEPLRLALQDHPFMIKPNLRELSMIAGHDLESTSEQDVIAMEIIDKEQSDVVVVSLGEAGSLLATRNGLNRLKAPEVSVLSKVGAGDSMVAGIVTGLVSDKTIIDSVRYGVAAGTAAVISPGSGLCNLDDTERLFPQVVLY